MKNYLTLVLALSVVSSPAFASRARLESLGEAKNGSYYLEDSRNIFLNPAQIVHYKKKLFIEFGGEPTGAGGTANAGVNLTDQSGPTRSRGQGGFTNTFGDFTYGVYFNQTSERTLSIVNGANTLFAALPGTTGFIAPDSTLEVFFAGEGAANWGLSLWWAGNDNRAAASGSVEQTAKQIGARVGIETGGLEVFGSVGIISNSKNFDANTTELQGKVGLEGGVKYKMNEMTLFARYINTGADVKNITAGGATDASVRSQQYAVGAGWKHEMTKSTNLFSRLEADYGFNRTAIGTALATAAPALAAAANGTQNYWNVPVAIGAETQALSWLTIRGSIQESLLGEQWGAFGKNSLSGTTTIGAGVGLTFGDIVVDGLIATSNNSYAIGNDGQAIPGFGTTPKANSNWGFGDNMLSRIALTYNF